MKGGGITLHPDFIGRPEDAFTKFYSNSAVILLTTGSSGLIFKLTLNPGITSPYVNFDHSVFFSDATTILVKVVVLDPDRKAYFYLDNKITTVTSEDFTKEVLIHKEIIESSQQYLDPLGPSILLCFIAIASTIPFLTEDIKTPQMIDTKLVQGNKVDKNSITCGVMVMEIPERMNTVYNNLRDFLPKNSSIDTREMKPTTILSLIKGSFNEETIIIQKKMIAYCICLLIELGENGFGHGDYHLGNFLANIDVKMIDFGRSVKFSEDEKDEIIRLKARFMDTSDIFDLKQLVDYIQLLNTYKVFLHYFKDDRPAGYGWMLKPAQQDTDAKIDRDFNTTILNFYGWFTDPTILELVKDDVLLAFDEKELRKTETMRKCQELLGLERYMIAEEFTERIKSSTVFINTVLKYAVGKTDEALEEFKETKSREAAERLEVEAREVEAREAEAREAESRYRLEAERVEEAARGDSKKRKNITEEANNLLQEKKLTLNDCYLHYNSSLDELKNAMDGESDDILQEILRMTIEKFSDSGQGPDPKRSKGGGAKPPLDYQPVLQQMTSTMKEQFKKNKDKEIQTKIDEILKIKEDMNNIFAKWRDTVYDIYTDTTEARNEFYQTQTPFNILVHVMVCCGLFGPLTSDSLVSRKYIDVKETENKELHDRLNLIAEAFSTMNNGYISMFKLQLQTMMENTPNISLNKMMIKNPEATELVKTDPGVFTSKQNSLYLDQAITRPVLVNAGGAKGRKTKRRRTKRRKTKRRRTKRRRTKRRVTRKCYKRFSSKCK
jgi:hypothetical protein